MNQSKQFVLLATLVFVLTVAVGLTVTPVQDAAAVVYLMIAVVLPAPVAYVLVYLDGLARLRVLAGGGNSANDGPRDHPDADDREADPEDATGPAR